MTTTPISDRLDDLHDQWVSFAENPGARILVWQARGDEEPLIDAFVASENDDASAQTADTFLKLLAPFTNPGAHGYALREELIRYYDQIRPDLKRDGLPDAWECPHAQSGEDNVAVFLRAVGSLREYHAEENTILCVWLDADEVRSDQDYLLWLQRLARTAPSEVRFIVVDAPGTAWCTPLLQVEPVRVVGTPCELDMPSALAELAQQAHEDAPSPGTEFRLLLAQLGSATAQGSLDAAVPLATAAVVLATGHGWPHLAALVHLMVGSAYSAHGQPLEAAKAYTEADRLGEECESAAANQQDPADSAVSPTQGRQLRLNARFGQAATMMVCGAWEKAAEVYLAAVPLAAALHDDRSELDCLRLASVCFTQHGELDKAWQLGMRALQHAQTMDQEVRATSTFPYLGDHLLRMAETHAAYSAYQAGIEKQFAALLGSEWRPKPLAGTAA